jgi:hypothetical protein
MPLARDREELFGVRQVVHFIDRDMSGHMVLRKNNPYSNKLALFLTIRPEIPKGG